MTLWVTDREKEEIVDRATQEEMPVASVLRSHALDLMPRWTVYYVIHGMSPDECTQCHAPLTFGGYSPEEMAALQQDYPSNAHALLCSKGCAKTWEVENKKDPEKYIFFPLEFVRVLPDDRVRVVNDRDNLSEFGWWLLAQQRREDPVGDIAREAFRDTSEGRAERLTWDTPEQLQVVFEQRSWSQLHRGMLQAVVEAGIEYKKAVEADPIQMAVDDWLKTKPWLSFTMKEVRQDLAVSEKQIDAARIRVALTRAGCNPPASSPGYSEQRGAVGRWWTRTIKVS